ncbi:MAG TPA: tetratricopeptide repeat protein, partial [Pyrinomonadaceae bacterium]|nr:tetratricopeptide repeat protein [Pyrinomonadaceae bacterium]
LYECLTSQQPFGGKTTIDLMWEIKNRAPLPPSKLKSNLPHELDEIVLKLLAKNPEERFQSAAALKQTLSSLQASLENADNIPTQSVEVEEKTSSRQASSAVSGKFNTARWLFLFGLLSIAAVCLYFWNYNPAQKQAAKPVFVPSPQNLSLYREGASALRDSSFEKARKLLEQAVIADGKYAPARAALAEALMELDYVDKANKEIIQAILLAGEQSLPPEDDLYIKAVSATLNNDFPRAIGLYSEIVRLKPNDWQPYLDLGRTYERSDDVENAITNYQEATKRYPQYASAFLRLGILYGRKSDLEKAKDAFAKAEQFYEISSNDEGKAEVFYRRGALLNNLNENLGEAETQLQKVLMLERASDYQKIKARLELSSLSCSRGNAIKAKDYANEAIKLARQNRMDNLTANGLIDLGIAHLCSSEYPEAESSLKQAVEHASEFQLRRSEARAKLQLGSLYVYQGNLTAALDHIKAAREFYEKGGYGQETLQTLVLIGQILRQKNDFAAALSTFQQQLQLAGHLGRKSQTALAQYEIGLTHVQQENYPAALSHLNESRLIYEQSNDLYNACLALINIAESQFQSGRYDEAQKNLDKSVSLIKNLPEESSIELLAAIYLTKARIAVSRRDFPSAKTSVQQAINTAGAESRQTNAEAKTILALTQVLSEPDKNGAKLCGEALDIVKNSEDSHLTNKLALNCAEVSLRSNNPQEALTTASQLGEKFAASGQFESELRSCLIAASGARAVGDTNLSENYRRRAAEAKARLESMWGTETLNNYLARPDIQYLLNESISR